MKKINNFNEMENVSGGNTKIALLRQYGKIEEYEFETEEEAEGWLKKFVFKPDDEVVISSDTNKSDLNGTWDPTHSLDIEKKQNVLFLRDLNNSSNVKIIPLEAEKSK